MTNDLELPNSILIVPLAANHARAIDQEKRVMLDLYDEPGGMGFQITVYTASGNPQSPKRIIWIDEEANITIRSPKRIIQIDGEANVTSEPLQVAVRE